MSLFWPQRVRAEERRHLARAATVFALTAAGGTATAAGADAWFLGQLGAGAYGWALAGSSLLAMVVLALVGALSDRGDRGALFRGLASLAAMVVLAVVATGLYLPAVAAVLALVLSKQVQASLELVAWTVNAERFDARQASRLVPVLSAAAGAGAVLGALTTMAISLVAGPGAMIVAGVALWLGAGVAAGESTRRLSFGAARVLSAAPWRDGLRSTRRHPLASHLAVIVAIAGIFSAMAYFVLAAEAATSLSDRELARFLAGVRGAVQAVSLLVGLTITPRLLDRAGAALALLIAPVVALLASVTLVVAPGLVMAVVLSAQARFFDATIEAPAERLAQNLLPNEERGRIAGFLEGTAKRLGAVIGAALAALAAGGAGWLGGGLAVVALAWLVVAATAQRRIPEMAVAALANQRGKVAELPLVDDRVAEELTRALPTDPVRIADLLVRLDGAGRGDALAPLVRAAESAVDAAAGAALHQAIEAVACHARRRRDEDIEALAGLALAGAGDAERPWRALGLVGAAHPQAAAWAEQLAARTSAAAVVPRARLRGEMIDEAIATLDDDPGSRLLALREWIAEAKRRIATVPLEVEAVLGIARELARAVRRRHGGDLDRAAALDALAAALGVTQGRGGAERVLLVAEAGELARSLADRRGDTPLAAPELAASALGVIAVLADPPAQDDVRLACAALGDREDRVREAADEVVRGMGAAAAPELLRILGFGRRAARDHALRLLADLPVTKATLDGHVDDELEALDRTQLHLEALADLPRLCRRLDERTREVVHTVLLLLAARDRRGDLGAAAKHLRHAVDATQRARVLAALDAALPRPLAGRLVDAMDAPFADRARAAALRLGSAAHRDDAIRRELGGGDRLARALLLHELPAAERAAHRDSITAAAAGEVKGRDPLALLRRIAEADEDAEGASDMPTRVETLLVLGKSVLLGGLAARQLADVAALSHWHSAAPGHVVASAGERLDALIIVADGELRLGPRRITAGEAVDELAPFAPRALSEPLVAAVATRYLRIERLDLDELVEDVPGMAPVVLRAVAERARG